jgi:choline-glycine betaine transporter
MKFLGCIAAEVWLLVLCNAFIDQTVNGTIGSDQESPDSDQLNILFGVFTLMLIIAIMSGVAFCIVKGNHVEAENDDNEHMDDITEKTSLTSSL